MATWLYSGASVVGQSHVTTSVPCQDKFKINTSKNGAWLAVAVCDGAGSAEFAEEGATITSQFFCQELIKLSQELDSRPPGEWINDFVIDCILQVRKHLRSAAKTGDIRKYHCTLAAALVGESGGFSIHIGDGAILGGVFEQKNGTNKIELNSNFFISKPENGEYANETFFITEGNWVKHLRVMPLPRLDWIVVCTDGGASLLLDNELQVKPSFLAPFIESQVNILFNDPEYIENILNDPKANKITTDDKTIVVGVRSSSIVLPSKIQFTDNLKNIKNKAVDNSATSDKTKGQPNVNDSLLKKSNDQQNLGIGKKNKLSQKNLYVKLIISLSSFTFFMVALFSAWMYKEEIYELTMPQRIKNKPTSNEKNTVIIDEKSDAKKLYENKIDETISR
jgi:Protein phosphatase 2C